MAKRPSKHLRAPRPLSTAGFARLESKTDGDYMVQSMGSDAAAKPYSCPGCNQQITPGTAHLVAWPRVPSIGATAGVDERRHWHTGCWRRRQ